MSKSLRSFQRKAPSLGNTPLSTQEVDRAKKFWVKQVQQRSFLREFRDLSDGRVVAKSNPLIRLVSFMVKPDSFVLAGSYYYQIYLRALNFL